MKKAEEYCERAILGNTNDGNVLSLYADLILHNHGDRDRAHTYYQQAVKMSPEDWYIILQSLVSISHTKDKDLMITIL